MGEAHHIFASTITDDPEVLEPARLGQFDAAVLNNTLGECFGEGPAVARHARALVEFVQDGKGLVGIHGAAVVPNFQNPPTDEIESQYRLMLGAAFEKPASLEVSPELRVEDPLNPVCAVFDGMERYPLPFKDEILQLKAPVLAGPLARAAKRGHEQARASGHASGQRLSGGLAEGLRSG